MPIQKTGILVIAILLLTSCVTPKSPKDPIGHIRLELGPGLKELIKVRAVTESNTGQIKLKVTSIYGANVAIGVVETYYDAANVKLGESPFGQLKAGPGETVWYNTWSSGIAPIKEIYRVVLTRKR